LASQRVRASGSMDAMIFAAGLGTRLRPLTEHTPKALIEVGGVPMLERTARRLIEAGADRIIVNLHHHADQIERFVNERLEVEAEILLSWEGERPLETGGGMLHASPLFRHDAPFFLHNVDVITDFDLTEMYRAHLENRALATLAVNRRATSRFLLFDEKGLYGWENQRTGERAKARPPSGERLRIGFAGVHVVSPEIFDLIEERGTFSIVALYVRLAAGGRRILPFEMTGAGWLEIGTPERLEKARSMPP
ncbi:MAG: NDP-sugar synthase, partial [Gemmatimonadota bacterium]